MLSLPQEQSDFLKRVCISEAQFLESKVTWDDLEKIAKDYLEIQEDLDWLMSVLLKIINKEISHTSAIRHRIKSLDHLLAKIIRKNRPDRKINVGNYLDEITDIIGVRIIHLFKKDGLPLYVSLKNSSIWQKITEKIFYYRTWDNSNSKIWEDEGFDIKVHESGYRSQHYIIQLAAAITGKKYFSELQIRTIYEDAWWEIDHTLKYPDNMEDVELWDFSLLLNRLSWAADELCSFMQVVGENKELFQRRIVEEQKRNADKDAEISRLTSKIEDMKKLSPVMNSDWTKDLTDIKSRIGKLSNQGVVQGGTQANTYYPRLTDNYQTLYNPLTSLGTIAAWTLQSINDYYPRLTDNYQTLYSPLTSLGTIAAWTLQSINGQSGGADTSGAQTGWLAEGKQIDNTSG